MPCCRWLQKNLRPALAVWMHVWKSLSQSMWNGCCVGVSAAVAHWVAVCGLLFVSTKEWVIILLYNNNKSQHLWNTYCAPGLFPSTLRGLFNSHNNVILFLQLRKLRDREIKLFVQPLSILYHLIRVPIILNKCNVSEVLK